MSAPIFVIGNRDYGFRSVSERFTSSPRNPPGGPNPIGGISTDHQQQGNCDMSEAESPPESPREESLDARLVRELANVLNQTGLTEIEVERADIKIRVAKAMTVAAAPLTVASHQSAPPTPPEASASAPATLTRTVGETIKSPMVGTVYLQSQPGSPPFAKVGDHVTQGQTLLLIEAMKTMNPIGAPAAGVVLEILVSDSQPVEYGEPLVVIG
jgi:acetyl-CoA carboxylase biotin carboxyl carrier protein